jgi:antitoxin component YwqK of YwqJK toxin-antitoxin module
MKIIVILCLVLLVSCSQEPEVVTGPFVFKNDITYDQNTNEPITGIVEEFYENGQLHVRRHYKEGKRDGVHEEFHVNGQLSNRGNYKDGKQDGFHEYFDKRGTLTRTMTFRNGVPVESNWNP